MHINVSTTFNKRCGDVEKHHGLSIGRAVESQRRGGEMRGCVEGLPEGIVERSGGVRKRVLGFHRGVRVAGGAA
jgi:hypothetical protein